MAATFRFTPKAVLKDTIPKINLLKKIGDLLKFHKNIRTAEQKRILGIIGKTFLKDSIMANAAEIRQLNLALSDTINQRFDSLVSLINAIRLSGAKTDTLFPAGQPGAENDTLVSDSDISELVDKILPLIKEKIRQEKITQEGADKLKIIRAFYGRAKRPVDTLDVNDTLDLILTRKAEVYSFYPSGMEGNYLNYNFSLLNSLIYDGYQLDGRTGNCINKGGPATDHALEVAQNAGCRILLTIADKNSADIGAFLQNEIAQEIFIDTALKILSRQHADGINIMFEGLDKRYRENFVNFIRHFSIALKSGSPAYQLTITLPPTDKGLAYDVNELDASADKFLIDFSANLPGRSAGPLVPLKGPGNNALESVVSRYLNANIAPSKFIISLPYYGAEWKTGSARGRDRFSGYFNFNEIAAQFPGAPIYDPATFTACINLMNDKNKLTGQVWYDDAKTLDAKYDFIIQNGLGGLAVSTLGTKDGYSNIWSGIANKFLEIDTLFKIDRRANARWLADSLYLAGIKQESLGTAWRHFKTYQFLSRKIYYLFEHPCASIFVNDPKRMLKFEPEPIRENRAEFYRILRIARFFLTALSILFFLILMAVTYAYIYHLRKRGEKWRYRKWVGGSLILLVNILILLVFMLMFLSDDFPGFGSNDGRHICYDMPLQTLLLIIGSGVILGTVVMRYLIFPIIKKDDLP